MELSYNSGMLSLRALFDWRNVLMITGSLVLAVTTATE